MAQALKSVEVSRRQVRGAADGVTYVLEHLVRVINEWAGRTNGNITARSPVMREAGRFFTRMVTRMKPGFDLNQRWFSGGLEPELKARIAKWKPAPTNLHIDWEGFFDRAQESLEARNVSPIARFRGFPEEVQLSETDLVEVWKKHKRKTAIPWCDGYSFGFTESSAQLDGENFTVVGRNSPEYISAGGWWYEVQGGRAVKLKDTRSGVAGLIRTVPEMGRKFDPPSFWTGGDRSISARKTLAELVREFGAPTETKTVDLWFPATPNLGGGTEDFKLPVRYYWNPGDRNYAAVYFAEGNEREVVFVTIYRKGDHHYGAYFSSHAPIHREGSEYFRYVADAPGSDTLVLFTGKDAREVVAPALGITWHPPGGSRRESVSSLSEVEKGFRPDLKLKEVKNTESELRGVSRHALTHLETIRRSGFEDPEGEELHDFLSNELFDRKRGVPSIVQLTEQLLDEIAASQRRRGRRR